MRGWMVAPIVDRQSINWGLIQRSDRYEGEFTADDEDQFLRHIDMRSVALELAWQVRDFQKAQVPS